MYPLLGYSPDIYNQCKERYNLPKNHYDHLKEFFAYCESAQVPILAHASPLGMSIGDGFNFIINDQAAQERGRLTGGGIDKWFNWLKYKTKGKMEEYDRKECALCVDQTNTHTLSWKRVIDQLGDVWFAETRGITRLADWRRMISDCITSANHIYTDISCYVMSPYRDMGYKQLYTRQIDESAIRKREKMGRELVNAMNKNQVLFNKIIMGSDWYMTERSHNGTGECYKGMFLLLQQMSKDYDGGNHDLWYQFSVINPLRFLGLIPDDPGTKSTDVNGNDYYELDTGKIIRYLDKLKVITTEKGKYSKWWKYAGISDKWDIKEAQTGKVIGNLRQSFQNKVDHRIYTAAVMMKRAENQYKDNPGGSNIRLCLEINKKKVFSTVRRF